MYWTLTFQQSSDLLKAPFTSFSFSLEGLPQQISCLFMKVLLIGEAP